MKNSQEIVEEYPCKCGCGLMVKVRKWALCPSKKKPEYIKGHQQWGNKRGWKTGEVLQNGYVKVYSPNHPYKDKNGYVKRSRLIVENHLGRFLQRTEVVHHINGIRNDDSIDNLKVLTHEEHMSLHHKGIPKLTLRKGVII